MTSSTLATPSAKAHERIKGRWMRDIECKTRREWMIYYAKMLVGTPLPWFMWLFSLSLFFHRPTLEVASWAILGFTSLYIFADRLGPNREFRFFLVGSDLWLLGYTFIAAISALVASGESWWFSITNLRWVILIYGLAFAYELFPGLNRLFYLVTFAALASAVYGLVQHYTGHDVLGTVLTNVPVQGVPYFLPTGFFQSPELFANLIAVILPLPLTAYLLIDKWEKRRLRLGLLIGTLILLWAIFLSYRPGLWIAVGTGILVSLMLQNQKKLKFLFIAALAMGAVVLVNGTDPSTAWEDVLKAEEVRATAQRTEIKKQLTVFEEKIWLGGGSTATSFSPPVPRVGNVYFQILAESGILGLICYFFFILATLLGTYQLYKEIPSTHYWHRVLVAGGLGSQVTFHVAGLYWPTLSEAHTFCLFALIIAATGYTAEHYSRGLVPDDYSI